MAVGEFQFPNLEKPPLLKFSTDKSRGSVTHLFSLFWRL